MRDGSSWPQLYERARRRKGWTYDRLALEAGINRCAALRACHSGDVHAQTAAKLASVLGLLLILPPPPRILTAQEAQTGTS